ncbi:MAG: hypothetical protein HYV63_10805 [Candidatus Schekmanbacteria bacterium]|nr:hypothetical protein [Candidatus Schekmanbacteria bacterium]
MSWKRLLVKWLLILSIFPLTTFYHECLHGIAAELTGGTWEGLTLNFYDWHYYAAKPFELLTLGFIQIEKIAPPDGPYAAGFARILGGRLTHLVSAAAPNFAFAFLGAYLLLGWLPSRWDASVGKVKQLAEKVCSSAVGAYLIYQPYEYGKITLTSSALAPGNDFGLIIHFLGLAGQNPSPLQAMLGWILCVGAALAAAFGTHTIAGRLIGWRARRVATRQTSARKRAPAAP